MKTIKFVWLIIVFVFVSCTEHPVLNGAGELSRATPEAQGISSEAIINFLDAADKSSAEFHSVVILRHGKIVAEGWWYPYQSKLKHTMYSVSKSFTSTAIGLAVQDGLLSVDDKVVSFFPEYASGTAGNYVNDLTVKDLLTMTVGQAIEPVKEITPYEQDWVKAFLYNIPITNKPGTEFLYNSMGSHALSAIVQKVTGKTCLDYLNERLFIPLNIKGMDWEIDPMGINTGGWGLRLKSEDMAKFGQLYLQEGNWNGKQIISSAWVTEASTKHIGIENAQRPSVLEGYGYQFWRAKHNGYMAGGAFGQYILILPDYDAVIIVTQEALEEEKAFNLISEYLIPAMQPTPLPNNPQMQKALKDRLKSLSLPLLEKGNEMPDLSVINGKTFAVASNDDHIESVMFKFSKKNLQLQMTEKGKKYDFLFGEEEWLLGETTKPGPNILNSALNHFATLRTAKVAGTYAWTSANTLELILQYIESPHSDKYTFVFDGDEVSVNKREFPGESF